MKICQHCEKKAIAKGLCANHYMQERRKKLSEGIDDPYLAAARDESFMKRILAKTLRVGDCLEWQGNTTKDGYALSEYAGRCITVHRLILTYTLGRSVRDDCVGMHSCDNSSCIESSHINEGTQYENIQEMISRGRANYYSKGEGYWKGKHKEHPCSKKVLCGGKEYCSASVAARELGMNIRTVQKKANGNKDGFSYI